MKSVERAQQIAKQLIENAIRKLAIIRKKTYRSRNLGVALA